MIYLWLLAFFLFGSPAQAAVLIWDTPTTGLITIEKGLTEAGPFEFVATIPVLPVRQFPLLSGNWGFYRITQAGLSSNVVKFSLDLYTGTISDRLDALEVQMAILKAPIATTASTNLLTTRQIDSTHVELLCAGTSMSTATPSKTSRIVTCIP